MKFKCNHRCPYETGDLRNRRITEDNVAMDIEEGMM